MRHIRPFAHQKELKPPLRVLQRQASGLVVKLTAIHRLVRSVKAMHDTIQMHAQI